MCSAAFWAPMLFSRIVFMVMMDAGARGDVKCVFDLAWQGPELLGARASSIAGHPRLSLSHSSRCPFERQY